MVQSKAHEILDVELEMRTVHEGQGKVHVIVGAVGG